MGILNITPDSFSDGGRDTTTVAAIERGLAMVAQGAHIIDIGGESTRPNFTPVSVDEELARVLPVVKTLAAAGVCVSIDTHKPQVMQVALDAGASIVNDVNALCDEAALKIAQTHDCGLIVMDGFSYENQTDQAAGIGFCARLAQRYQTLLAAGIAADRLVIDPGIGFNKTHLENLACIRELPELKRIAPTLIGVSNKSVLGHITGKPVGERGPASVAAALVAAQRGAAVLRVHDVAATRDALAVWRALL